jgi:hypothetical protein
MKIILLTLISKEGFMISIHIKNILELTKDQIQNIINYLYTFVNDTAVNPPKGNVKITLPKASEKELLKKEEPIDLKPENKVIVTFPELISKVTQLMSDRKISAKNLKDICEEFGLQNIAEIANHPDLIPKLLSAIEKKLDK